MVILLAMTAAVAPFRRRMFPNSSSVVPMDRSSENAPIRAGLRIERQVRLVVCDQKRRRGGDIDSVNLRHNGFEAVGCSSATE
jgi:hypothetical protein